MTLAVGTKIDGWCGACKVVIRHTVVAVAEKKITRVHCNTCGRRHAHRVQPPRARRGTAAVTSRALKYQELLGGRTQANSTPYSTAARFRIGELVSHAAFGLGIVTGARDGIKIDILFAEGAKVLQHGCERSRS